MRTVYVNGAYVPEVEAKISVFDRGFLYSDAVYEVSSVVEGMTMDNDGHLARLRRSLETLNMRCPIPVEDIPAIQRTLIERNGLVEGMVYLQVTRGAVDRDFLIDNTAEPTLVLFTQAKSIVDTAGSRNGIRVKTHEDIRWKRRDIKTTQLLAQSLAKQAAADAGCQDAWMVEDGHVTEASSSNVFIVTDTSVVTRPRTTDILHGITRQATLDIAREFGLKIDERRFTVEEAQAANEAFSTGATTFVLPVVEIDGVKVGDGTPGAVTKRLRERYLELGLETARAGAKAA